MALHDPPLDIPFFDKNTNSISRPWADWLLIAKRDKANRLEGGTENNLIVLDSNGNYKDASTALPSGGQRIVSVNSGSLSAVDLDDWIAGTADQITVTDDTDGSVTLSTPQDIATDSSPTFNLVHQIAPYHFYTGFQNESETITLAGADTWTWITNVGNTLWAGVEEVGISISGDIITISNAGDYTGSLSITMSGLANKDFEIRLYNITQAAQSSYIQGMTSTGTGNYINITLPLYVEAAAGDTFRIEVQCTSVAPDNPVFEHAVFYLQYLHD